VGGSSGGRSSRLLTCLARDVWASGSSGVWNSGWLSISRVKMNILGNAKSLCWSGLGFRCR
jgi:hypothetical protein